MTNDKKESVHEVIPSTPFPTGLFITVLIGAILVTSGSAATHVFAATQPATALPNCTDPTGQNLPCMMVISTLPPPPNAIQCQETSGQILPCSYATQNLSNGEQIVAITVYVPANYVFSGYGPWMVVKEVVHETITKTIKVPVGRPCERADADAKVDLDKNLTTRDCDLADANEHVPIKVCEPADAGAKTDPDVGLTTKDCDLADANEHKGCERPDADAKTDLDRKLKTIDCDLGDANEHGKAPLTPLSCNSANYNGTCPTFNNTKTVGGVSGIKSTCVNNCTTGTPPPVDCTKNPTDPSCTQALTPSQTTPATKTCPDGSQPDSSGNCPSQPPSNPSNPSGPPSGNGGNDNNNNPSDNPSTDNNPPPSNDDNGKNNPDNGANDNGGDSSKK